MFRSISIEDLNKLNNPIIIDIRSVENYNNNHMPNAINIPYSKLVLEPKKYLNKDKVYYIYCQKGMTSRGLSITLNNMGYKVYNIIGGYEKWLLEK